MYTAEPQIIPLLAPADIQSAGSDLDSINMGRLHKVKILILLGAITGNDTLVQLYAGATAGAKTTELAFKYRKSTVDVPGASADVFGDRVAVAAGGSGIVFADAADFNARVISIDVMADEMPDGKPWLTVAIDDGSASVLLAAAVAIGSPREAGDTHTTAL